MSGQEKISSSGLAAEKVVDGVKNESNGRFLLAIVFIIAGISLYYWFLQKNIYFSFASGGLSAVFAVLCFMTSPQGKKLLIFFKEAKIELKRITWPDRSETQKMTIFVLVVIVIAMLLLAAFDAILKTGIQFLFTLR